MAEQYAHLSPLVQLIRVYGSELGYENKDPYLSVLSVIHTSPDTVVLEGAKGSASLASIEAVRRRLLASGVKVAYVDRAEGHTFLFGEVEYVNDGVTRYRWEL